MDMDHPSSAQHQQLSNQSLENMIACSKTQQQDKKPRPQPEQAQKCPRCDSTNTKFCYYNNYSLSQPRYFCKSCRRYWTKGGTLRNVPVGGGCRKNKRSSSSSSSSSTKRAQDQAFTPNNPNPLIGLTPMPYDSNDLNLALARLHHKGSMGFDHDHDNNLSIMGNHSNTITNTNTSTPCDNILGMNPSNPGFLDALRNGFLATQQNNNNNNMQGMYFGYGNGEIGEVENNGNNNNGCCGDGEMMMMPYDHHHQHQQQQMSIATTQAVSVTTMKQELCNAREQNENKVLWGFPWQLNNNGDTNMVETIDSGRASWNNGFTSSWHGLLNSPLM